MPYHEFTKDDIFYNTIESWPSIQIDVTQNQIYLNNRNAITGAFIDNVGHCPVGSLSLYELNVDRPSDSLIYPFVTKDGSFESIGNVSVKDFFSSFEYGDVISGTYPLSASFSREYFAVNHGITDPTGSHILALQQTLNSYTPMTPHYEFSSSLGDKNLQELGMLNIPSIFYGSNIRKGSVKFRLYISGTLAAELSDPYFNGELVQTGGSTFAQDNGSNSVGGVILYNEGIAILTGSWDLTPDSYDRGDDSGPFRWIDFAAGANDGTANVSPSASFKINFDGINYVETLTMFASVDKSDLNFSPNKTYLDYESYHSIGHSVQTSSVQYKEPQNIEIFNTVSSSFYEYEAPFAHQTFISKIGIYDEHKNLIAIANLATPIKKNGLRDFTFKLKLDI